MDTVALRRLVYRHFADTGAPPHLERAELEALEAEHAVVLSDTGAVELANPFAAPPTDFIVSTGARDYAAVCAWDALGILAALDVDGRVKTSCPDCGEQIAVEVAGAQVRDADAVVHFLVPAARWYEDLRFT